MPSELASIEETVHPLHLIALLQYNKVLMFHQIFERGCDEAAPAIGVCSFLMPLGFKTDLL